MWFLLRLIIGGVFLFSSLGKLISPYQNFLYVIQAYQLLPSWGELLTAQVFPWIELIVGTFVFLGLWTPWALRGALVLFGVLVLVVGQATKQPERAELVVELGVQVQQVLRTALHAIDMPVVPVAQLEVVVVHLKVVVVVVEEFFPVQGVRGVLQIHQHSLI